MKDRIQYVIKAVAKTKSEFAKALNISPAMVSMMCSGEKAPSDRTKADICRVFCVNPVWLETGEGDPFQPKTRGDEIAEFITEALTHSPEEDRKLLIDQIQSMSDAEIMILSTILRKMFP